MSAKDSTAPSRKGMKLKRHGLSGNPLWNRWRRMIQRCHGGRCIKASHGGRGIAVCDRWRNSFDAFVADMGEPPTPAHQIERKDNDGNYEPGNCRWATPKEQARNRRDNCRYTINGETRILADWLPMAVVPKGCVEERLARGWPLPQALFIPAKTARPKGQGYGTKHFQVVGVDCANRIGVQLPTTPHGGEVSGMSRQPESRDLQAGGVAQLVEQRTFNPGDKPDCSPTDERHNCPADATLRPE